MELPVGSWGGNIHNEHVRSNSSVALYKAVEMWDENLCHVGKFVAYELKENEDEDEKVRGYSIQMLYTPPR